MEQLYVEVLYTIRHKLGAHSAKYPHHFKEDLVHYAQTAFGVGQEYHRRCNAIASEEKVNTEWECCRVYKYGGVLLYYYYKL
jgi:hypothetical protein